MGNYRRPAHFNPNLLASRASWEARDHAQPFRSLSTAARGRRCLRWQRSPSRRHLHRRAVSIRSSPPLPSRPIRVPSWSAQRSTPRKRVTAGPVTVVIEGTGISVNTTAVAPAGFAAAASAGAGFSVPDGTCHPGHVHGHGHRPGRWHGERAARRRQGRHPAASRRRLGRAAQDR